MRQQTADQAVFTAQSCELPQSPGEHRSRWPWVLWTHDGRCSVASWKGHPVGFRAALTCKLQPQSPSRFQDWCLRTHLGRCPVREGAFCPFLCGQPWVRDLVSISYAHGSRDVSHGGRKTVPVGVRAGLAFFFPELFPSLEDSGPLSVADIYFGCYFDNGETLPEV